MSRVPLRDRVATSLVSVVLNRIATVEYRDRLVRALLTGDPEHRVPVENVVRRG